MSRIEFTVDAADAKRIRAVAGCASPDSLRSILKQICLEPDGMVVATDSYRIAWMQCKGLKLDAQLLLPAKAIARACDRLVGADGEAKVTVEDGWWSLKSATQLVGAKLPELPRNGVGVYPELRSIIPAEWPSTVDQVECMAALNPSMFDSLMSARRIFGTRDAPVRFRFRAPDKPVLLTLVSPELGTFSQLLMPVRLA